MSTELPLIQAFLVIETASGVYRRKLMLSVSYADALQPVEKRPCWVAHRDVRLVRLSWQSTPGVELDLLMEERAQIYTRIALPSDAGVAVWASPVDLPVIPPGVTPTVEAVSVGKPGRSVLTFDFAPESGRMRRGIG